VLPRLHAALGPESAYAAFLAELRLRGFEGDIAPGEADRTVLATDNSIYQLLPQAALFPRTTQDLVRIARVGTEPRFASIRFAPHGGGTGTNGQSLTDGVVVDVSRHMNRVLEIDPAGRWVRVQAGVVKDQLNAALAPHGLFFAPELSTSNRATIGGMVSTDACGQGSCLYGKTRDHVLELTSVLLDGTVWTSRPLDSAALEVVQRRPDPVGAVHRLLDDIVRDQADAIVRHFPNLNRCLTGYDLAHLRDGTGRLDMNAVLCGSEGTLAFLAEAKLNVLPIPRHAALVNIRYDSFDAALRDARALMAFRPASIETVDEKVLGLAQDDIVWQEVQQFFPGDAGQRARGVNLVEFVGDAEAAVDAAVAELSEALRAPGGAARLHSGARGGGHRRHLEHAKEVGRPARQHAGWQASHRLRRRHRCPARAAGGLHRRVPGGAGCTRAGIRHVRPRRRWRAARAARHRPQGPGAREADPRDHRGGRRDHQAAWRPALG
jgi:FAD/FMN-containing dehydrogenase